MVQRTTDERSRGGPSPSAGSAPPPATAPPPPPDAGRAPAAAPATESGEYEELTGAEGRAVFFRPERYRAADLGQLRPVVHVTAPADDGAEDGADEGAEDGAADGAGGVAAAAPVACRLHDVSQNGVAFRWTRGAAPAIGAVLPRLQVAFDGYTAYDGAARVSSARELDGDVVVGAAFVDSLMDIHDVLLLRDVRAWETRHAPRMAPEGRSWHVEGHAPFKARVSEFRLFLEDAAAELEALEAEVPSHVLYRDVDSAARRGLLRLVRSQFVGPFVDYCEDIDRIVRDASSADWQVLREFSHRQLQHLLLRSPFFSRCLHKPLGYPGDYLVLSQIYDRSFHGPHLFGRALDYGQVSLTSGEAVRNRKDRVRELLLERVRAPRTSAEPVRFVSVASGPAQEFVELVDALDAPPEPVEIVLFDQDKEALAYAFGRLRRLVDRRFPDRIRVTFLHDSIRRLLHDPEIFHSFGPFDAIVCAGLFDYLTRRTAIALAAKLHGELREGGVAWIGNMRPCNPSCWIMGMHGDWQLIYRTTEELLELGAAATGGGDVSLAEEATGVNPFLVLRR